MDTVGMVILAISALPCWRSPQRTSAAKSVIARTRRTPPSAADPPSDPPGSATPRRPTPRRRLHTLSLVIDQQTLFDRAGGMPFFEALVGRFYAGVADDPVLRPDLPRRGPGARPAPADALPRPVLGRAADLRRRNAATRACGCATRPFAIDAVARDRWLRAHARRDRRAGSAAGRGRRPGALHRGGRRGDAQPRLTGRTCGRPAAAARPGHWYTVAGGTASGGRHWRTPRRHEVGARPRTAARPSTARRPTPATASSPRTTRRSRPISRPRSRRRPRTAPRRPARRRRDRRPGPVVVLDFGSQFAQLIARRVRELDVYSELLPHDTPLRGAGAARHAGDHPLRRPDSVYDDDAPKPDPAVWSGRIPVLGICYGAQLMARELGGDVLPAGKREYGPANVTITDRRRPVRRASSATSRSG